MPIQCPQDRRGPRANAGEDEHKIGVRERRVVAGRPENDLDWRVAKSGEPLRELFARLRVRDRHACAARHKEARETRRRSAFAQADDRHATPAEVLAADLRIEEKAHASLPMKPSCVP